MVSNENQVKIERPKILVVDDEMMMRVLACESLKQAGFESIEAASGEEAQYMMGEIEPDLILLDIVMHGMSGFDFCDWLRIDQNDQRTPVLIMTGLDDRVSIDRAYEVGATDFITKPINYPMLSHRIRYLLRQKSVTDQLRISEERLVMTQEVAQLGSWESTPGDPFIYLSRAAQAIFSNDYVDNKITREKFYERVVSEDVDKITKAMKAAIDSASGVQVDFRVNRDDGQQRVLFLNLEPQMEDGVLIKMVGVFQDITDRREAEDHIHRLSHYDGVTGLENRSYFIDRLAQKIRYADERKKGIAVFMIGIDNFKVINQSMGFAAGNQLLAEISDRLQRFIRTRNSNKKLIKPRSPADNINPNRENDLLASLGGDEFALALWGVRQAEEAGWIATAILQLVKAPIELNGQDVVVSCSTGISFSPLDGTDPNTLLKNAEVTMNYAKSSGKGGHQLFSESMNWQSTRRLALESDMRRAVEQEQFQLHFQPKINIADKSISGVESLIRWIHPDKGFVSPGEFIPVAEETGQIIEIGKWVLEEACKQAKIWADQGQPLCVSINVSMLQLRDNEFCQLVSHMLARYELEPHLIQLELVESMLMDSMDDNSEKMRVLRELGVTIAIDDFGTGYSSMAYLSELPLDVLKIDKSFIDALAGEQDNWAIVEATVALAHALGLKVVAEGVEEQVQVQRLEQLDCDEIQGYYYSRPLNAEDFDAWRANFSGQPAAN